MRKHARYLKALFLSLFVVDASARIISYAPVSDQYAQPAVQSRLSRYYLLMESETAANVIWGPIMGPYQAPRRGQFVLYDSKGLNQPRVLFENVQPEPALVAAALWEGEDERPRLLAVTDARVRGDNPERATRMLFSGDGGASWRVVSLPSGSSIAPSSFYEDVGGLFVRGRGSQIRLGSGAVPFVFNLLTVNSTARIYGLLNDGRVSLLAEMDARARLVGSDRTGLRFLVAGALNGADPSSSMVRVLDVQGQLTDVMPVPIDRTAQIEGWITPDGAVYLQERTFFSNSLPRLTFTRDGTTTEVARAFSMNSSTDTTFFAVPTFDYSGAWILQRAFSMPTVLSRHQPGGAVAEQWRDITAPQVEALHPGSSGRRLLIQVHRPRPMADTQRLFIDPALAIWETGQGAPGSYEELYLIEGPNKGFVHLDVEAVREGGLFIFDSASHTQMLPPAGGAPFSPAIPGGAEVVQEWGVVRASLQQRLVLPGIARIIGAYGSTWRTDLAIRSTAREPLALHIRYAPSYETFAGAEKIFTIPPGETWVIRDALKTIFDIDEGGGAFFISPPLGHAVHVTSRTYTNSVSGTYGMGAGAIDIFAAAGPRFPLTFSGAFQGPDFRTNVIVTDTSGRGTGVEMKIADQSGIRVSTIMDLAVRAGGQSQFNNVTAMLNAPPWQTGSLVFRPTTGEALASVIVIDNRTNDPTYFPPDLPAPYVRTIPVIGHVDGANGSKFRSDLFLFNPSDQIKQVVLAAKPWNENVQESRVNLTLLPFESKVIKDVLFTAFNKTGLARLRYQSGFAGDSIGIRATSRTYTVDPDGATYGMEIPPLNSFQGAGPGDTLEILGTFGDNNSRVNLALVELSAFANFSTQVRVKVEILDDFGKKVDSFETQIPSAGGVQLLDLFRERGLGSGPPGALIRVSPLGGLVGAFATLVDNGTNDPTYFGAVLAARE